MVQKNPKQVLVVNGLGTFGYITCTLQWIWLAIVFMPSISKSPVLEHFFTPAPAAPIVEPLSTQTNSPESFTSPILLIFGFVMGIAILAAWFYVVFAKVPKAVARTGENVTHVPAKILVPIITKNTQVTPAQKKALSSNIVMAMKFLLVLLPFGLLFFAQMLSLPVPLEFILTVGIVLFGWALFLFTLQFLFAHFFQIDYRKTH